MNPIYTLEHPAEDDLLTLYEKLDWNSFLKLSSTQLLTAMNQSFFAVYAYINDELVATGRVISDGVINAYVCGLGVLPEYRRQGIGTEIMRRLKAHCMEHNLHMQFLCEEILVPYYNKLGFEKFAVGMR